MGKITMRTWLGGSYLCQEVYILGNKKKLYDPMCLQSVYFPYNVPSEFTR